MTTALEILKKHHEQVAVQNHFDNTEIDCLQKQIDEINAIRIERKELIADLAAAIRKLETI